MKYKKLGKLPIDTIEFFKFELLKRKIDRNYQWIQFDKYLNDKFNEIFSNTDLEIQFDPDKNRFIQKAFYSNSGYGYKIHKDGVQCKSALNIVISCNDSDWVRWYDDSVINNFTNSKIKETHYNIGSSRDCNILEYENVPFIEELRNEVGDVYILDVDTFHSFKCNGPKPRIVIQTKFRGYPTINDIHETLSENSFNNIITDNIS